MYQFFKQNCRFLKKKKPYICIYESVIKNETYIETLSDLQ